MILTAGLIGGNCSIKRRQILKVTPPTTVINDKRYNFCTCVYVYMVSIATLLSWYSLATVITIRHIISSLLSL
uniref:Uncharacterized protein n=1 Tax=Glossina palpalis gambiensis TaxID=67801 RepID=A0A1B0BCS7_9MUSC